MPDLDQIRELYPEAPAVPAEARRRARLALVERMEPKSRRVRGRLLLAAGVAVGVVAAAVVLAGVGDEATVDARAASVLRDAAAKTRAVQAPRGPRRVLYVKSVDAYLSTWAEAGFSVLVPHVREVWSGPRGGLLDSWSGEPRFLSARDRARWIAAGRPQVREPDTKPTRVPRQAPSDLPTDAGALFDRLEAEAKGHSEGTNRQMFTLVADAFRETNLSAAQRAALYEVAARVPGVELIGSTKDPAGRAGVAVAMDHPDDGMRHTLVVDPETGALLSEQRVTLAQNSYGYPAGTVVGHSTYLVTARVDAVGTRPR
jgi:hypothetical protein